MRRGRPKQAAYQEPSVPAKPSANDPFASLDSKDYTVRAAAVDELASKFPSLDEFSILHDQGRNYQFGSVGQAAPAAANASTDVLKKRVTEALADEAFAKPKLTHTGPAAGASTSPSRLDPRLERAAQPAVRSHPSLVDSKSVKSSMVSTGVQTSPMPSPSPRPIWKVPSNKSDLTPRSHSDVEPVQSELPPRPEPSSKRHFLERTRTKSQTALSNPKASVSSRPSLEGQRPSLEYMEPMEKARSSSARPRPSSTYVESNLDFLRDQESDRPRRTSSMTGKTEGSKYKEAPRVESSDDEGPEDHIASDVQFLKTIESNEDTSKKGNRRRSSSGAKKRAALPSISLSGTKNILAGKFGDAFRRFETNSSSSHQQLKDNGNDHDKSRPLAADREPSDLPPTPLSPIMGSEAASTSQHSDDAVPDFMGRHAQENALLEDESSLSPEVRRELERRRLSQEEKRVAAAAAEYRQRLNDRSDRGFTPTGHGTSNKASSIQNRVKSLLDDSKVVQKPVQKTAEGYGKYTDTGNAQSGVKQVARPLVGRKPVPSPVRGSFDTKPLPPVSTALAQQQSIQRTGPRVAPKPLAFRTGGAGPGVPSQTTVVGERSTTAGEDEDWEANFAKRYPSLSGIEMVETEIAKVPVSRVRDV
jgi:AP2-associated kinase